MSELLQQVKYELSLLHSFRPTAMRLRIASTATDKPLSGATIDVPANSLQFLQLTRIIT
jgi:hypothetical protein